MLIECEECHGKVSNEATTCPNCGKPTPFFEWKKSIRNLRLVLVFAITLQILGLVIGITTRGEFVGTLVSFELLAIVCVGNLFLKAPEG
jgi:hypothetical protein